MQQDAVIVEMIFDASVERVWKALTDKAQMKEWYFDVSDFKPETGFEFQFSGKGKEGETYLHLCKVTEIVPENKLTYSWRYDGFEGISFVTFELIPEGKNTGMKLTHVGLETFPMTEGNAFAKENFIQGWTYLIQTSLKDFVETE